jgi:aminoglycoside phosphotransferase (APT) family kinase protein
VRTEVSAVLTASGIDPGAASSIVDIGGGTYNAAYRIHLTDGRRFVLKIAPDSPGLTYEHDLLATEAEFFRLAGPSAPVPSVVHAGPGFLLMTELPGDNWYARRDRLDAADHRRLRANLGAVVANLHTVTGDRFGYPQDIPHPTWTAAFIAMMDAVLADAARFAVPLPRPAAEIAYLVRGHGPLLDLVETPVLVHFDLWDGNILIDDGPGITGIVDAERAFWGDPIAEFVSLCLFKDVDGELLDGYRGAGGVAVFGMPGWRRLELYRVYLYVIMLVEMAPRGDGDVGRREFVWGYLVRALDSLQAAL